MSIAQLEERLAARGSEGRRLHINVAAHSRLLDSVLDAFRERVSGIRFNAPAIPFISNLTGTWADARTLTDPEYWVRHLRNPVRFSAGLRQLLQDMPDSILVEAGPGQGLCALARQNNAGPRTILPSTSKAQEPNADLALMLTGAGALWTRGVTPDWAALRNQARPRRVSLPTYAFDHQRHWIEPTIRPQQQEERREAATPSGPAVTRLASYDDWFRVPEWTRAPAACREPAGRATKWLVFGNHSKLTSDIVSRVTQDGGSVTLVHWGQDFARKQDGSFSDRAVRCASTTSNFWRELERSAQLPDHILHLWAMDTMPGGAGQQLAGQALAFDSLLNTAKAIQELDLAAPLRLTVVTAGSQAVTGEAVPHPERALALGPCRVIPREIPNVSTRLIDLAPFDVSSESVARFIVCEAQHADEADLVAWRDGERWTQQLVRRPQADRQSAAAGARGRRLSHHRRAGRHRAGPGRLPGRQVQGAAGAREPARPAAKGQLAGPRRQRQSFGTRAADTPAARAGTARRAGAGHQRRRGGPRGDGARGFGLPRTLRHDQWSFPRGGCARRRPDRHQDGGQRAPRDQPQGLRGAGAARAAAARRPRRLRRVLLDQRLSRNAGSSGLCRGQRLRRFAGRISPGWAGRPLGNVGRQGHGGARLRPPQPGP